jgi:hypothetical protein
MTERSKYSRELAPSHVKPYRPTIEASFASRRSAQSATVKRAGRDVRVTELQSTSLDRASSSVRWLVCVRP